MHYQEFSKRIKEKYPQYNDIDDRELATKIVAKYPQYQVDFDDNRVASQTVSTQQGANNSSPIYPQVEQPPVSPQGTTFAEGMGRIGNAVSTGVGNFVDTVKANPMQFTKDSVNSFVVQPTKEFLGNVVNPDVKKSPWLALAGGIAKGAVELPQNIQNTVADIQDTYHGVEGMHNKWNYTDSIKDAVKSNPVTNLAYETVAEPMRNNEGLTTLAEFGGMGGAGLAPVKGISKLNNMAKVANQTARITAKLDDAQKLKYAKQIDKLAKKRVAENAKTYINPALKEFNDNVLLGGALGALEGETLEERASNAVGGFATGAIAHGAVKGAGKAYNKAKPAINEAIKNASESDLISKGIANIDSMLNTNISKNANELTQKRKEYRDLISKDTSLAKNLDQKNTEFLESLGELSEQENLELLERIKQGDKKYSYAEKKAERKQKAIEQQKAREAKEQQEAKEFFDNLLEEEKASTAPVSEVSNPVDINTPKLEGTAVKTHELPASVNPKKSHKEKIARQQEIIKQQGGVQASDPSKLNIDIKSQIEAKRRSKPRSFVVEKSGDNTYFHGEDGVSKVYNKNGKSAYVAEGARSLEKRTAGEENVYKNHEFYDNVVEDGVNKNYVKEGYHEVDASEPLYKYSQDTTPEFMKWYDEYSKADSKTKNKMLSEKLKSYKTQDEASKFYEKFSEQEMMGNQAKRAKKVGDETYDTADVSETKRLTEAIENDGISYEKANKVEAEDSKAFKAYVNKSLDSMYRGKAKNAKTYIKGTLMAWKNSADFQKEYNKIIDKIGKSGFSPKAQEAMINEINAIADSVVNAKKRFNVTYKKTEFKQGELYKNAIKELENANARGDLAKGKQIIERNDFKRKYLDANGQKALDEHYTKSVEKAHKGLSELGIELSNENGTYTAKLNKEKAIEWAKNEVKAKIKDETKLKKALDLLDKKPEVAIERAKSRGQKILDANKNIIANDIKFAYEASQKQFKEGKLVETGDTWDRQSSDVDAGARRAEQTTKGIAEALRRDDGYTVKELSNAIKGFDKKSPEEVIKTYEKYGDLLDKQYIEESGKESVPVSELPSTKYRNIINNAFDNSSFGIPSITKLYKGFKDRLDIAKASAKAMTIDKLSQKVEFFKEFKEDLKEFGDIKVSPMPNSMKTSSLTGKALFSIKTAFINMDLIGNDRIKFATTLGHELEHFKQDKLYKEYKKVPDQQKTQEMFEHIEAYEECLKVNEEKNNFYANNVEVLSNISRALKNLTREQKEAYINNLSRKERGIYERYKTLYNNYHNTRFEVQSREAGVKFAEKVVNSGKQRLSLGRNRRHDATGLRGWNDRSGDVQARTQTQSGLGETSVSRGFDSEEINSKGKMDEANTEAKSIQEEKVVKFTEGEFSNEKINGNDQRRVLGDGVKVQKSNLVGTVKDGNRSNDSRKMYDQHGTSNRKLSQKERGGLNEVVRQSKEILDEFKQPTDTYSKFESKSAEVRGAKWVADKLNKDILQAKLDDGEITQEQATNRLIQQGGGEDAVYLKQISSKQGKIIFGEKENTKVGIYGEKKSDGLAIKGSAQKYLANRFEEHIRIQRDQNIIKFLKENFSNQQKKGFVPVNTKLLRIAMTRGFSKAWYETLVKGESAIREVFPNEAQAKAWVDLSTRTKANEADLYIPEDLFEMSITGEKELPLDYLKTYGRKIGINQFKAMGKIAGAMLDYHNDRFKRKVLTSASFFTNNRFGNQIMLMANASSPAEYFRSIKDATKLKDIDVPAEILESTLAETIQQELGGGSKLSFIDGVNEIKKGNTSVKRYFSNNQNNFLDNIVRLLDGTYIDAKQFDNPIHKAIAHSINGIIAEPNAWFKQLSNTMMGINAKAERFERKQAFAQSLNKMQKEKVTQTARKMATVKHLVEEIKSDSILRQTVIDKVADVLGDYNNFNKFEKNFMKRIIPFYAWNRTILRHSIALCKDNPTKLALIALKTLELHTQDDGLEDYQHGALKTGIYDKTAGKNLVINKTKMIPYATLFDMASGESIGSISPGIKKPIEAVQGEKWFKPSSEIQNKRYKRMSHKGQKGYLDTKTGEFKEGGLPTGARLAYVGKDALETVYPHIGSPLTKGVLSKDVIDHHNKTGEWRLPDKQYDASLGGFYDGDYIGSYNGKAKKRSAKMKMDLGHQVANRLTGLGLQPEQRKAQKEKWKKQSRKLRGY